MGWGGGGGGGGGPRSNVTTSKDSQPMIYYKLV